MNESELNHCLLQERAEANLRMRLAVLTDDQVWLHEPTFGPMPEPVERVFDTICVVCLIEHIMGGDWSEIDPVLLGTSDSIEWRHLH